MRITVLGKSPAWQDAGGACSGYLVEEDDTVVLIDCGNGVFSKLRAQRDYGDVDAIFVSHMHADHFFDLIPFAYALLFSPRVFPEPDPNPRETRAYKERKRPKLFAPPGSREIFTTICKNFHDPDLPLIDEAFELREYDPAETISVGPISVRFREVPHWVQTCAMQVTSTSQDSGTFTFGADCAPSQALVEFARDSDLLLLEATLPWPELSEPRGHLCAAEAGEHAAQANARRLVLTHISDEMDSSHAVASAAGAYAGPIQVATEGDVFEL